MLMYSDDSVDNAVYGEKITPAHKYTGINDFRIILNDMMSGVIPTNTHFVYPTIWKADRIQLENEGEQNTIKNQWWR
jgi:hypothetical protein